MMGTFYDPRATELWDGEIGAPHNVLDRMKAINYLVESGLSEGAVQGLDDLIAGIRV